MSPESRVKISPSILAADFACLGEEVTAICEAGCDYVHVDVMDGHFVPNLTIGPGVVKAIKPHASKPLDVHLMISPVDAFIDLFAEAGADIITFHPEAGPHPHRTVQAIKAAGCKAGISLNPATPIAALEELIEDIDLILVMSVNPGFGGQKFIKTQLEKIRRIRDLITAAGREIELEVDGGVNSKNAEEIITAGAILPYLLQGTAVFQNGRQAYADNIKALRPSG